MNSQNALPRVTATLLAAAFITAGSAVAAPKKPEPAPAVQPAPAPEKKGMFSKAKELIGLKKKDQPAPQPAEKAPADSASKPAGESKSKAAPATEPVAKAKAVPAEKAGAKKESKPAVAEAKPEKKGWLKGMFSKSKDETPTEPALAKAKTAKPAPVKEVKPAKADEKLAKTGNTEPKAKRGLFGFFRKLSEPIEEETETVELADEQKIERPEDWQEHRIVKSDDIALYTFGPAQANGPDERLQRGTVVKVKAVKRGWALVEVKDGVAGYMDASMLREAAKTDFKEPPPPAMAAVNPDFWAPLAPPPDLPDSTSQMDADAALLLLPPLELEQKPNP